MTTLFIKVLEIRLLKPDTSYKVIHFCRKVIFKKLLVLVIVVLTE